ncbi:hypothetical protein D3C79_1077220 [compost metagenome]
MHIWLVHRHIRRLSVISGPAYLLLHELLAFLLRLLCALDLLVHSLAKGFVWCLIKSHL